VSHHELAVIRTLRGANNPYIHRPKADEFVRCRHISEKPLGQEVPASKYTPSTRRPHERTYDPYVDGCDEKRSIGSGGTINWKGSLVFVSEALEGRVVGLRQLQATTWSVRFYGLELGVIVDKAFTREPRLGT